MFQPLLRNWLLGAARQKLREAAEQAAQGKAAEARPPDDLPPPEVQRDVCHVGLMFALGIEAGGLVDRLSGVIRVEGAGFVAREGGLQGRRLLVFESGVGAAAAARATRALIAGHQPQWIISAGFAGGLQEGLAKGDILMADTIVDTAGRKFEIDFKLDPASLAGNRSFHVGRLLSVDRIIADPQEKRALGVRHHALAVDLESLAVAAVCRDERVRFLAVRVISDAVDQPLPSDIDYLVKQTTTASRLGAAAGAILRRPSSVKDMWQLKEDALLASERLARFVTGVISQLR